MNSHIILMQEAILAKLNALFDHTVRPIEVLEGAWNQKTITRVIQSPPSLFVTWLKSRGTDRPYEAEHTWLITVAAKVIDGRRANELSTYHIIERIEGNLDGNTLTNAEGPIGGPLMHDATENLWTDGNGVGGISIYVITFKQTMVPSPELVDANIGEFLCYFESVHDPITETNTIDVVAHPRNPGGYPDEGDHHAPNPHP